MRGSLRGYRTLVAGVVGIVAITILAMHGEKPLAQINPEVPVKRVV